MWLADPTSSKLPRAGFSESLATHPDVHYFSAAFSSSAPRGAAVSQKDAVSSSPPSLGSRRPLERRKARSSCSLHEGQSEAISGTSCLNSSHSRCKQPRVANGRGQISVYLLHSVVDRVDGTAKYRLTLSTCHTNKTLASLPPHMKPAVVPSTLSQRAPAPPPALRPFFLFPPTLSQLHAILVVRSRP